MYTLTRRIATRSAVFALALAAAMAAAQARPCDNHDRAREAVRSGEALPLKTVLERLQREHPGQVLEVDLEQICGRLVYAVKLLQTGGRLVRLEVDASSAEVLRRRGRGHGRPHCGPP